jgi:hypothetical protein
MKLSYLGASILVLGLVSTTSAEEKLIGKTYPVADLVVPLNSSHGGSVHSSMPAPLVPNKKPADGTCEEELIQMIKQTVAPKSWSGTGGQGTIEYYPLGVSVVVQQTARVHEELGRFLKALSRQMDNEVALEVRVVVLAKESWENWLKQRSHDDQGKWYWHKRLVLDEKAVLQLTEDKQTICMMQLPKLTTFDGQHCCLEVGEQYRLRVHSRVGETRDSVGVSYQLNTPGGAADGVVVSASGQTTLIAGWCTDPEAMYPSSNPNTVQLKRKFKNTPKVCFMLMTPRVICPTEATNARAKLVERTLAALTSGVNSIAGMPFAAVSSGKPTMRLTLKVGVGEGQGSGVIQVGGIAIGAEVKSISETEPATEPKTLPRLERAPIRQPNFLRASPMPKRLSSEPSWFEKVVEFFDGWTLPFYSNPLGEQMQTPKGRTLEHTPQYFPQEPDFPLPRELSYQEERKAAKVRDDLEQSWQFFNTTFNALYQNARGMTSSPASK